MVETAGSKAPNRTAQALLDSAYALSRRDYFMEKSWFVGRELPRRAFADIFRAVDAGGAAVTLDSMGLRVRRPLAGGGGGGGAAGVKVRRRCDKLGVHPSLRQLHAAAPTWSQGGKPCCMRM